MPAAATSRTGALPWIVGLLVTVGVVAVIALHTTPWTTRQLITPIFWIGWTLTLAIAELLIRSRRRAPQ